MSENKPESVCDFFFYTTGVPEVKHLYVKVGAINKREVLNCLSWFVK